MAAKSIPWKSFAFALLLTATGIAFIVVGARIAYFDLFVVPPHGSLASSSDSSPLDPSDSSSLDPSDSSSLDPSDSSSLDPSASSRDFSGSAPALSGSPEGTDDATDGSLDRPSWTHSIPYLLYGALLIIPGAYHAVVFLLAFCKVKGYGYHMIAFSGDEEDAAEEEMEILSDFGDEIFSEEEPSTELPPDGCDSVDTSNKSAPDSIRQRRQETEELS